MSPDVSRRLGLIVGRHWVSPDERDRVISATLDAEDWEDIPQNIRDLLAEIGQRGALPTNADPTLDQIRAMAGLNSEARARELALLGVTRALGHDVTPGHDELHHYWVAGKGRALWENSPTPWRTLYALVTAAVRKNSRAVSPEQIKRWVSRWFIQVKHYAAGSDLNRVAHGKPPRGHRVGPG